MPTCFVPHCNSGYAAKNRELRDKGLPHPHFFTPSTEAQRARWEVIIKRKDSQLTQKSRVCSEHFLPEHYDEYFETTLKDGTISRIPRDRAKLKSADVVPTIFKEYPTYYQPKGKKRKQPTKRSTPKKKSKSQVDSNLDSNTPENNKETSDMPNMLQEEIQIPTTESRKDNCDSTPTSTLSPQIIETWSCLDTSKLALPTGWVLCNTIEEREKKVVYINEKMQIDKCLIFKGSSPPVVQIMDKEFNMPLPEELSNITDAQKIVNQVDTLKVCLGTGLADKKFSVGCSAGISNGKRCRECKAERERIRKIETRRKILMDKQKAKVLKHKRQKQVLRRSKANLLVKVQRYRRQVEAAIRECEMKKAEAINEAIGALPKAQQEAVKACFQASKRRGPSGRRYTSEWIYECLLMKIKDKKLYNHIRNHQILPLPCNSTMNGYLKNYSGSFGFQLQTLDIMKIKSVDMEQKKRHGMILIDEMKLTEGVYFDSSVLKVQGFKDMGEDRVESLGESFADDVQAALEKLPVDLKEKQKIKRKQKKIEKNQNKREKNLGDHALVITFQPFMGTWVQAIGAFLTRGNADDNELTKLILEAVILLERSGYFVDGVVTDGATWNRAMWRKFGVDQKKPSSEHPCDPQRKLWFISDFPHLLKCMRNCFCSNKIINTPRGQIKWDHWKAVLDADSLRQIGLRECPRLTEDHLHPNPWQKMNVAMAWQFWSLSVVAGMESYKLQGVDMLDDCHESTKFCKLVNDLADSMNSNRPVNAMKLNSPQYKVIEEFLEYFSSLKKWRDQLLKEKAIAAEEARVELLRQQGKKPRVKSEKFFAHQEDFIFSDSTDTGLLISLKGTLELVTYLVTKCNFEYIMTARFNQDALERFFGLVRQSCGGNTHPEPRVFAQLFRLLSIYSLVKPVKGSNITGGEMVSTLLNLQDLRAKDIEERKKALSDKLDEIIENGENLDHITEVMDNLDHEYMGESVDDFALSYVGGFVARHFKKYAKTCEVCQSCLRKSAEDKSDLDMLITVKSRGWLTYAADGLVTLLRSIEENIIAASLHNELDENILFVVLERMENVNMTVAKIGCDEHKIDLTKSVMKFYIIMRMHFLSKRWNEKTQQQKKKQKGFRKNAHLT